jgi:dTMP kinase
MAQRFITFEGGEGTGKSTHAQLLAGRLESAGINTLVTHEPGGSLAAEVLRHLLLSGDARPFGVEVEALLFALARNDHVRNTIEPALAQGVWVVCDRFIDSTRVYQGSVGHLDLDFVRALEQLSVANLKPDLTFVLDVPVEVGLARASKRRAERKADRFEAESRAFHEALREAFRQIATAEPARFVVIDGTAAESEVAERIWTVVAERFDLAQYTARSCKTADINPHGE